MTRAVLTAVTRCALAALVRTIGVSLLGVRAATVPMAGALPVAALVGAAGVSMLGMRAATVFMVRALSTFVSRALALPLQARALLAVTAGSRLVVVGGELLGGGEESYAERAGSQKENGNISLHEYSSK